MSQLTRGSRPSATLMLITDDEGSTIGRFDSAWGATGTSTSPSSVGCRIGPSHDSA